MTSHGMAAWMVQRLGDREQRRRYLADLNSGQLAAVGFSEPEAGSDLSAMQAEISTRGESVVVAGEKMWVTGACYADLNGDLSAPIGPHTGRHPLPQPKAFANRMGALGIGDDPFIVPAPADGEFAAAHLTSLGCHVVGTADHDKL